MKGFLKGDDIAVDEASAVRLDAGASEYAQSGPIMTPATAKIGMNAEEQKQFVDRMLLKWWVAPKKSPAWSGFFSPMIPA